MPTAVYHGRSRGTTIPETARPSVRSRRLGWPAVLSLLAAAMPLISCGGDPNRIALVPKGTHHIFWEKVREGAAHAGKEFGYEIEWVAPVSEADTQRQIDIVNALADRELAGIALAPIDEHALVPAVRKASANGIPVAIFDSAVDTGDIVSYVATDNSAAGRLAARRMGKVLQGTGNVAVVSFMPGSAATTEREQAFQDELQLLFPDIHFVAFQYGMADQAKAESAATRILEKHADLAGIFADNESSSIGVLRALKQHADRRVEFVGFDLSEELVEGLQSGTVDSLIVQNPFRMGYETVKSLARKAAGLEPAPYVDSGARLVLPSDVDSLELGGLSRPAGVGN